MSLLCDQEQETSVLLTQLGTLGMLLPALQSCWAESIQKTSHALQTRNKLTWENSRWGTCWITVVRIWAYQLTPHFPAGLPVHVCPMTTFTWSLIASAFHGLYVRNSRLRVSVFSFMWCWARYLHAFVVAVHRAVQACKAAQMAGGSRAGRFLWWSCVIWVTKQFALQRIITSEVSAHYSASTAQATCALLC